MDKEFEKELALSSPIIGFNYSKVGYECTWHHDTLEDNFCRVDRSDFFDKSTGRAFQISEIKNMRLRWVDTPGGIFKSRRAGYQITAEYKGQSVVMLDGVDKMTGKCTTRDAQALFRGEKNILKVAIATVLLAHSDGDMRRSYFEVFDRYGSDAFDTFPWPDGILGE